MTDTAIILAGGFGTRLRSRVADLPKPMAPIAGRPFLAYLLDRLQEFAYSRVILSVGYRADAIESCFGNHYGDLELIYSHEDEPLGTGGAILRAIKRCDDASALVLNGDTFLELDYRRFSDFHQRSGGALSLTLREVPDSGRYGRVVIENGRVVDFSEKGAIGTGWINAGVYLLRRDIFDGLPLPEKFSFELDFLVRYCPLIRPQAFCTDDYMIDIGIPEDFDRAQTELPQRAVR